MNAKPPESALRSGLPDEYRGGLVGVEFLDLAAARGDIALLEAGWAVGDDVVCAYAAKLLLGSESTYLKTLLVDELFEPQHDATVAVAILAAMQESKGVVTLAEEDVERLTARLRNPELFTLAEVEAGRAVLEGWLVRAPQDLARAFALDVARGNTPASSDANLRFAAMVALRADAALVFVEVPPNHRSGVAADPLGRTALLAESAQARPGPRHLASPTQASGGRASSAAAASATWAQRSSPSASRASRAGAGSRPSSAVSASRACARSCAGSGVCQPSALARSARAERIRRASSRVMGSSYPTREPGRRVATAGRSWAAGHGGPVQSLRVSRPSSCRVERRAVVAARAGAGVQVFSVVGSSFVI